MPHSEQWPSLQPSAGLPTLGDLSRLAAAVLRPRRGCPLRLAALGGSSTAGHALQRWSPALFHALLEEGILLAPSAYEVGFLSTAHTSEHVQRLAAGLGTALSSGG